MAAVAAAVVHQDNVAGLRAFDALGNNIGAGLLPVGGVDVPADFRSDDAVEVGSHAGIEVAARAAEDGAGLFAGNLLDGVKALRYLVLALLRRHLDKAYALAGTLGMVPGVGAYLAAHAGRALHLAFVPGNALANGEEGGLGAVFLKDVQDLVGLAVPGAIVERERNHLVVAGVDVVVLHHVVYRFLGGDLR